MTTDPLNMIKFDFLYSKSLDCIRRALHRKSTEGPHPSDRYLLDLLGEKRETNLREYQLWAAIALELLGKAALAYHHPCFLVDPRGRDSILAAAGISSRPDGESINMEGIKTISATEVYKRLKDLIPEYDDSAFSLCLSTAANRNAELHTAASPLFCLEPDWEERYWSTCKIILSHIEHSLDEWLGEENAAKALQVIDEASKAREKRRSEVAIRISTAKQEFNKLNETSRRTIENGLHNIDLNTVRKKFTRTYARVWEVVCPSCENRSFVAGNETASSMMATTDVVDGEIIRVKDFGRVFAPQEFICIACDLRLSSGDEIRFADMYETHHE